MSEQFDREVGRLTREGYTIAAAAAALGAPERDVREAHERIFIASITARRCGLVKEVG